MKRRDFVKTMGLAAAGTFAAPYILPSGRLFARTGMRKVNHVVFCLYAGGVRRLESIDKKEGNLMPNMLNGNEPISPDIIGGLDFIGPSPLTQPLQNFGTLFKEFRYKDGPTGHFNGHTTAVTGNYTDNDLNIRQNPEDPTIFELYRKHNSPAKTALNSWWVSDSLGPYPALNYSSHPAYGASYGANFIAPTTLVSQAAYNVIGNPRTFSASEEDIIKDIRGFNDKNFASQFVDGDAGVPNTESESKLIQDFILQLYQKAINGQYTNPWNLPNSSAYNNDMVNILFAEEIIQAFQPELLTVNMQSVDVCHSNFTEYCNNLRKADYAVAHLWNTIQNTPGMANDTIMVIVPEHGRNAQPNSIVDSFGRYALDHTSDQMSREIFCMIVGPPSVVKQNQVITQVTGESIDVVPTIANILGFDTDIPSGLLDGQSLNQAFV